MKRKPFRQRCLVVGAALVLSACSVYQMPGQQPAPETGPAAGTGLPGDVSEPTPTPIETAPREAEPEVAAAYRPLLARAETASSRGDYEQALALLERAQRIDPDNAAIYLDLARTHAARGDQRQAAAVAERGLLYCLDQVQCDALREFLR